MMGKGKNRKDGQKGGKERGKDRRGGIDFGHLNEMLIPHLTPHNSGIVPPLPQ